jgi:hypothetical protein
MKNVTLETIYEKVVALQRDVEQIKKSLMEEPYLREDFIARMRDIDLEQGIIVTDFEKRYGLRATIEWYEKNESWVRDIQINTTM